MCVTQDGRDEADGGGIDSSFSVPFALRNPQCRVQVPQGRFTGILAPASQRNGETASLEFELWSRGLGGGDPGVILSL